MDLERAAGRNPPEQENPALALSFSNTQVQAQAQIKNSPQAQTQKNKMCRKVECEKCHKSTWKGCGQHIESALSGVKEEDRCPQWKSGNHS